VRRNRAGKNYRDVRPPIGFRRAEDEIGRGVGTGRERRRERWKSGDERETAGWSARGERRRCCRGGFQVGAPSEIRSR